MCVDLKMLSCLVAENNVNIEAAVQRYSLKKVFLEISQNSQENA